MLHRTHLALFTCVTLLTANRPAQARFYWDGNPVFSGMAPWEIILFGIIILAFGAAFLFVLVKLIHVFLAKK